MKVRKIRGLRVTLYARVSTDQDEQMNSLENQVQYYTELIQSKPNWHFVPGYIDEGISGGTTKKRDDFNRMVRDTKAGLFDFITTKEISRFSVLRWTTSNTPRNCWRTTIHGMSGSVHWNPSWRLSDRKKKSLRRAT